VVFGNNTLPEYGRIGAKTTELALPVLAESAKIATLIGVETKESKLKNKDEEDMGFS